MTIADRKAREKEKLHNLILESARKLFLENGIERTTIRNIADAIDYSPGTVYVYFKDKKSILHALHIQGFKELGSLFVPLQAVENPIERLKAMGKVYIRFALENSEMYDLMFNMRDPMQYLESEDCPHWEEGQRTFGALRQTVEDCMAQGHFQGHDVEALSFLIWSAVHGMCCLEIRERINGVKFKEPETVVSRGYQELSRIIERL